MYIIERFQFQKLLPDASDLLSYCGGIRDAKVCIFGFVGFGIYRLWEESSASTNNTTGRFSFGPFDIRTGPGLGTWSPKNIGGPTSPGVTHAELSKPQHAIC